MSFSAWRIAVTAAPSDESGGVSKEIVVAGNCPRWLISQRPRLLLHRYDGGQRHLPVVDADDGR